jgi:hypothetical protein
MASTSKLAMHPVGCADAEPAVLADASLAYHLCKQGEQQMRLRLAALKLSRSSRAQHK